MIQQVNLYQAFNKSSSPQSPSAYLLVVPLLAIILLCFSVFSWWSNNQKQDQLQQVQQKLAKTEAQVQLLQQQFPAFQIDSLLEQNLKRSIDTEHLLAGIVKNFSNNSSDQTRGFSEYFSALAKQSDGSTWLNRIYVNTEDKIMLLHGNSFSAEKIPYFLQQLQNEEVFRGRKFAKLTLEESGSNALHIDFTVTSSLEEIDEFNP